MHAPSLRLLATGLTLLMALPSICGASRRLVNLTRGLRFQPPTLALGISPTRPEIMYLGTGRGFIYVSRDGGRSWQETRVLVPRARFVGAIRPTGAPSYWPVGIGPVGLSMPSNGLAYSEPGEASHGTGVQTNIRNSPQDHIRSVWDAAVAPGGDPGLLLSGGGSANRLGVGLAGRPPWLTLALRKKRRWAIGINIKQTLSLFGASPIDTQWIDVNPEDPDDAFAATGEGLLRTTDGGLSWPVVLTGATVWERRMNFVIRNPHQPRQVFVATGVGLQVSPDDGNTFLRVNDLRVATMHILWITFHPTDPKVVYVGTTGGMFRSRDGGQDYKWVFVRPWPAQNNVRRIAIDPADANTVYLGTDDGLFVTRDGGDSFDRAGDLLFVGRRIRGLSSARPGHMLVATWRDLWETTDGGRSWHVVYFGDTEWTTQMAFITPQDPKTIWVVTYNELLKLVEGPAPPVDPDLYRRFKASVAGEPTSGEVVRAALHHANVSRGDLNAYRAGSRWAALVPSVNAGFLWRQMDVPTSVFADPTRGGLGLDQIAQRAPAAEDLFAFNLTANWDLTHLIFRMDEVPSDRYFSQNNSAEWWLRHSLIDMYLERRRLQLEAMTSRDVSPRARLHRALRIEELTAHMNYLTGDLFEPYDALSQVL